MECKIIVKDKLVVKKYENRDAMGAAACIEAAECLRGLLAEKEEVNAIFAAAPSQNEFLAALSKAEGIDWGRVNAFHMDEYIGLPADAPQGFGNFLKEHIFSLAPFKTINYINGGAADIDAECERYTRMLQENPVDIVFLGIGENGHIAFNDPHVADFNDPLMIKAVELDLMCRQQQVNDGCFETLDKVPTHALSLTIPTLISAGHMFCMVPAATKANAVKATVYGDITESCPASILRQHQHATLYVDSDSGAYLEV